MKTAPLKRRRRVVRDEGPDPIDKHVGRRVRERRLQAGLSQNEMGELIGVSFQAVQKYECADTRISASTLYRICRVLGVKPNDFFSGYAGPIELRAKKEKLRR